MSAETAAQTLAQLPRLCKAVKAATGCDGVTVLQNNEAAAGQEVFHAHFHVIPRKKNDGLIKLP
jgi:histidine triad (HIT) family protein